MEEEKKRLHKEEERRRKEEEQKVRRLEAERQRLKDDVVRQQKEAERRRHAEEQERRLEIEQRRRKENEARQLLEAERRRREEEADRQRREEEQERQRLEADFRQEQMEARKQMEAERRQKEDEAREQMEAERRRREEEQEQHRMEAERRRQKEAEARQQMEAERRRREEKEAEQQRLESEQRRRLEVEARVKMQAERLRRQQVHDERGSIPKRQQLEEEEQRLGEKRRLLAEQAQILEGKRRRLTKEESVRQQVSRPVQTPARASRTLVRSDSSPSKCPDHVLQAALSAHINIDKGSQATAMHDRHTGLDHSKSLQGGRTVLNELHGSQSLPGESVKMRPSTVTSNMSPNPSLKDGALLSRIQRRMRSTPPVVAESIRPSNPSLSSSSSVQVASHNSIGNVLPGNGDKKLSQPCGQKRPRDVELPACEVRSSTSMPSAAGKKKSGQVPICWGNRNVMQQREIIGTSGKEKEHRKSSSINARMQLASETQPLQPAVVLA